MTAVYVVPFDGESLTRPFVERAVARGVGRIVLLSGRGVDVPGYSGEASVAALTEGGHGGRTYELSGPRALTIAQALAEISGAAGREIRYVPLSPEEFVTESRGQGLSAAAAADYAESLSPLRRGLDSHVSDGVRRALGREPRDFRAFAKSAAANGAWRTSRPAG
ncbi:hypothetical protein [Streptomyces sp. NBC_01508]|uniref:hypothetical protein n=1 Tax=Streptomyces sp. NBC_01508 TaxID=2903888 RepID=UPI003864AB87